MKGCYPAGKHSGGKNYRLSVVNLNGAVCLLELFFLYFLFLWGCGKCEKLHQLSASEAINSTKGPRGRSAGTEPTQGHLFISAEIKPQALSEC